MRSLVSLLLCFSVCGCLDTSKSDAESRNATSPAPTPSIFSKWDAALGEHLEMESAHDLPDLAMFDAYSTDFSGLSVATNVVNQGSYNASGFCSRTSAAAIVFNGTDTEGTATYVVHYTIVPNPGDCTADYFQYDYYYYTYSVTDSGLEWCEYANATDQASSSNTTGCTTANQL